MGTKRKIGALVLAGAMAVGLPATASADDVAPAAVSCVYLANDAGMGCFDSTGDILEAHDFRRDGRRVVLHWQTDYGRSGECHNAKGAFSSRFCNNVDLAEHRKVRIRASLRDGANAPDESTTAWSRWLAIG